MSLTQKAFLIIVATYLIGFVTHLTITEKTVYGDGIYYFSWLRSIVIDHDISFDNEYQTLGGAQQITPTRKTGNIYAIGPSLLWAPVYTWIHAIIQGNGYTLAYQLTVGLYDVLLTVTAFVFLYLFLVRMFDETSAIFAVLTTAMTTNIFFYGSIDSVNSHSISFFGSTLLLLALSKKSALVSGAAMGILAATRIQDGIWILAFLPFVRDTKFLIKSTITCFLIFSLQMLAWYALYGTWWISPYINLPGYRFDWFHPQILSVLFSPQSGLFLWTPSVFFGSMVLVYRTIQTQKLPYLLYICILVLELYTIASWSVWWQGASFSGRIFVSVLPIISIGFAEIYNITKLTGNNSYVLYRYILLPLSILNMVMIVYFLTIT